MAHSSHAIRHASLSRRLCSGPRIINGAGRGGSAMADHQRHVIIGGEGAEYSSAQCSGAFPGGPGPA